MSLLSVRDLTVKFAMRDNTVTALDNISFDLAKGERLGIVGESGAGKSITGFSLDEPAEPSGVYRQWQDPV